MGAENISPFFPHFSLFLSCYTGYSHFLVNFAIIFTTKERREGGKEGRKEERRQGRKEGERKKYSGVK
jgi:hypothetical protein